MLNDLTVTPVERTGWVCHVRTCQHLNLHGTSECEQCQQSYPLTISLSDAMRVDSESLVTLFTMANPRVFGARGFGS
jgi:hypothetical protein